MRVGWIAIAVGALAVSAPVAAQLRVFKDQSPFLFKVPGAVQTDFDFVFPEDQNYVLLPSPYVRGVATFSGALAGYSDVFPQQYLGAYTGTFAVSAATNSIGLRLGSYYGEQTIRYSVGGLSGVYNLPSPDSTAFLGFTGLQAGDSISFTGLSEIDVVSFQTGTAVPEPAAWALMIVGFSVIGGAIRRRSASATKVTPA